MRLARKLTVALILGILLVLAGNAVYRVQREIALFETDSRRDSLLLGRTLAGSVARIWALVGEDAALDLVEDANQRESVRIRWVWLDASVGSHDGPELFPSEPQPMSDSSGEMLLRSVQDGRSRDALFTYVPVETPGGRAGAIEIRDSMVDERNYVRRTVYQALATTLLLVALCGGVAMGLGVALVGRPVAALIEQARDIGRRDFSRRLSFSQNDEIGELAKEMNMMCELLDYANQQAATEASDKIAALEQLRHADRLSTVGQLAAGIAHELGTPLNVIMGRAQLIIGEHGSSETENNALIIDEQARRMTSIIRQLLDFARRRDTRKAPEKLHHIAQQTVRMLDSLTKKASVEVTVEGDEEIEADIDSSQLQQALTNLIVNGVQAMPDGGPLTLSVGRRRTTPPSDLDLPEGRYGYLKVRDTGRGMPVEVKDRIFEPFFTTKPVGEGTGLGLSVAYGIVREHGGWIEVESTPSGSCITILLPERVG